MTTTATFAAVLGTLYVAHQIGDHWMQTHHQALTKGTPGWPGRLACARHVATYTATAVVMLAVVALLLPMPLTVAGVAAGQAVSAVTHYWADRRTTLRAFATLVGKGGFYQLGAPRPDLPEVPDRGGPIGATVPHDNPSLGTGAYALDQSFHVFWLWVAALVTTLL
jgi:Protein of unknown function (DUF3307)